MVVHTCKTVMYAMLNAYEDDCTLSQAGFHTNYPVYCSNVGYASM